MKKLARLALPVAAVLALTPVLAVSASAEPAVARGGCKLSANGYGKATAHVDCDFGSQRTAFQVNLQCSHNPRAIVNGPIRYGKGRSQAWCPRGATIRDYGYSTGRSVRP